MPIYNLNEYSDNYSDTSGHLWQIEKDKLLICVINPDVTTINPTSFKYKSSIFLKH